MSELQKIIEYLENGDYMQFWQSRRDEFGEYIILGYRFLMYRFQKAKITRIHFNLLAGYEVYADNEKISAFGVPLNIEAINRTNHAMEKLSKGALQTIAGFYYGVLKVTENDPFFHRYLKLNKISDQEYEIIVNYSDEKEISS